MLLLNELSPGLGINKNTFIFPHKLSGSELYFELSALTTALNENLGVIYSTSNTNNEILNTIKNQCEDAGKKVFLVSFTEPQINNGLNPFLNLDASKIAEFYFRVGSKEHEQLKVAFESHLEPITPEVVLKSLLENQTIFTNTAFVFEPVVENLEAIVSSINPFSNTDKALNVDLSAIINDGNVLILGGLNDPILADEFKTFIYDYYLKPLLVNNQINPDRNDKTYIITSSEAAIDLRFTEKVFAHGRPLKIQGIYTEHRTAHFQYESIHLIYANCQNKIKGDSPKPDMSDEDRFAVNALENYLDQLDGKSISLKA